MTTTRSLLPVLALAVFATVCGRLCAQEWTRFRGPNGTGISPTKGIPTEWTEEDYLWKVNLPGVGHSQPVLWGERLFVTSASDGGKRRHVLCIDAKSGARLWMNSYDSTTHRKHAFNSFASTTPTVDADSLYITFGTPTSYRVEALGHDGKRKWRSELGGFKARHGIGCSPILFENTLIVPNEQDGESSLIALERKTGKTVWTTPRRSSGAAYSTPCVYRPPSGPPQLFFTSQAHGVSAVEARTGKPLWEAVVFDKRACSSPVFAHGIVFGTCGSGQGGNYVAAIKMGGKDDVTESHVAYTIRHSAPYVPTPLIHGDRIFLWSDGGFATCADVKSGDVIWRERVGGRFFGSPVLLEGRLFCIAVNGEVVVLRAGDEFETLARNSLGDDSHSTPAIAGGRMFLRTFSHLICIPARPPEKPESGG